MPWKPSTHRLGNEILHIVGQGDKIESDGASSCDMEDDIEQDSSILVGKNALSNISAINVE